MPARTPEELDALFQQAINSGDVEAALALYEPGAVFANAQGELRSGLDSIRREMAPFAASKADIKLTVTKVIQAGDIALVYDDWTMTTPAPMSGRSVVVARRQADGSWRFLIDDPFTIGA